MTCSHLDQIRLVDLPEPVEGCAECLASGGTWVHLRMCQSCGEEAEPGEDWSWCYVDEVAFVVQAR